MARAQEINRNVDNTQVEVVGGRDCISQTKECGFYSKRGVSRRAAAEGVRQCSSIFLSYF